MKTNKSLPEIIIKPNIVSLAIAGVLTLIAIAAIVLSFAAMGSVLLIIGVILFFVKPKKEVYASTGSSIKRYSCYFDKDYTAQFEKVVRGDINEETSIIKIQTSGSGRIDVLESLDKEFIAVQFFIFVPHAYQQATEFITYTGPQAKQLMDYLDKCRKGAK